MLINVVQKFPKNFAPRALLIELLLLVISVSGNIRGYTSNKVNEMNLIKDRQGFKDFGVTNLWFKKQVRPPKEDEQSKHFKENDGLSSYTAAFSDNLKTHAKDVLSGDFTIFPELDKIVKERAKKLRHSDWLKDDPRSATGI